jgi:thiol-disulfide isomerase/thioredoxin
MKPAPTPPDRNTARQADSGTVRTARRAALVALAGLAAAAAGLWASRLSRTDAGPALDASITEAFFGLTLPDAAGDSTAIGQWRGRTLAVNFWAPWCGPCVEEMPLLSKISRALDPARAQLLGIGIDSAANIGQFARDHPVSYPLLVAGASGIEWARQFGDSAGGLPYTVIIEPDGRVSAHQLGRVNPDWLLARLQADRTEPR